MWLSEAKLGDQIQIFIDGIGDISYGRTHCVMATVIIGIGNYDDPRDSGDETYVLGWRDDEKRPTCVGMERGKAISFPLGISGSIVLIDTSIGTA